MTSLVLTNSSQLTADSFEKLPDQIMYLYAKPYDLRKHVFSISALLDSPQLLIAEEEKIIVEETTDNQIIVEEKSLVDTVYALKDQVKELQVNTVLISQQLEEEKRARSTLQGIVRTHVVVAGHEDIQWPPQIDS
uniref:Rho guanine nucleotide exchange factor 6/7 coiled-coil domain-containing protein n=1 Tax=Timema douglasi TaxID=61478 RepID=A0A7R8VFI4_TIMDO|nr:unnamed protein product [Timema douglasi]